MRRLLCSFPLFMVPLFIAAQIPVLKMKGWSYSFGGVSTIPITGEYIDFSLTRGADYFWEYKVDPQTSASFFAFAQFDRPLDLPKGYAFFSWGLGCNTQVLKLRYSGWEGGGFSGVFAQGEGIKKITRNYLSAFAKWTNQFQLGKRGTEVLSSISLELGFNMATTELLSFHGEEIDALSTRPLNFVRRDVAWIIPYPEVPVLRVVYDAGLIIRYKKISLVPFIGTGLVNFSHFIPGKSKGLEPLVIKSEYWKDFHAGIWFIPSK